MFKLMRDLCFLFLKNHCFDCPEQLGFILTNNANNNNPNNICCMVYYRPGNMFALQCFFNDYAPVLNISYMFDRN